MIDDHIQFLGKEANIASEKRISIISAPLANTVSWVGGTDNGPIAIIEASKALEIFDDELLVETVHAGIETLIPLNFLGLSSEEALQLICKAVWSEVQQERFPVVLGGEHTISVAAIAACARKYPDLHVVQFDAHLDLRDSYEDDPLSHACVMHRVDDLSIPFTQVGIRSFSKEEYQLLQAHNWRPIYADQIKKNLAVVEEICKEINGPVYLTFDVDCFDPAIMPATGTPEPGGLLWDEATHLIKEIAKSKQVVGLDFVEFAQCPGGHHAAFTVAKLIYRTLGYIFQTYLAKEDKERA